MVLANVNPQCSLNDLFWRNSKIVSELACTASTEKKPGYPLIASSSNKVVGRTIAVSKTLKRVVANLYTLPVESDDLPIFAI